MGELSAPPLGQAHYQDVCAALAHAPGAAAGARPVVVPGCGHFVVMEAPRAAARAIADACAAPATESIAHPTTTPPPN